MLWIGLLSRDFGIAPSRRLGIKGEANGLSFDLAVSLRLLQFDNHRAHIERMKLAAAVWGKDVDEDMPDMMPAKSDEPMDELEEQPDPFAMMANKGGGTVNFHW